LGVANVATIATGMHDVNLLMNNMQAGQQLQVYTRDGRHLLGSTVADNSLITSNLLTKENGFAQGATLDDSYLNKSGTAVDSHGAAVAYKGMQLFYGALASAQAKPIFNSNDKVGAYTYLAADLQGDRINALTTPATGAASPIFGDGAFTLNGKALGALAPDPSGANPHGPLQSSEIANWINKIQSDTGVRATASNEIVVQPSQMRFGMPLFVKASGVWRQVDTTGINSPEGLAKSINSAGVNLKASINASGNLVITNMSDHVGEDIQISATSADNSSVNSLTALGLGATTFRGRINLSKPAMDAITIDASTIDFGKGLVINGQSVWPLPAGSNTQLPPYSPVSSPPIPKDLADAINRKSGDTGVIARISQDANGGPTLVLGSVASSGDAKILITGTPSAAILASSKDGSTHYEYSAEDNALGIPNSTDPAGKSPPPVVSYPANPAGQSPADPIQLGFGTGSDAGTPADLARLGFRSGAYITGAVKDDLLVFVTGPGSAAISASYAGQPVDAKQNLRAQALKVQFYQDTDTPPKHDGKLYYTITSTDPAHAALGATTVAERVFDPAQLNPGVRFQGLNLSFTAAPQPGDVFALDGNQDGLGNNDNMLSLAALETKAVVGSKTLTNSYIDQVNEMGNIARQATISKDALTVVHDQAVTSRDQVSGVSLDKEAADLIRYQQAYQASAKVLQMAGQLFDAVLHVN
jgi:flagellar hook-associated protein FlgK